MIVRTTLINEVNFVTKFMKQFETCTQFVKVDIDYATKVYESLIKENRGAIFILSEDGSLDKMIGAFGCIKGMDLHFPRLLAIETFWYVQPEFRGNGLMLVKYFEKWAKENSCNGVAIIHLADSEEEVLPRVYKRLKYTLVEQHFVKEF